jgi:hypothetical protein
MLIIIFQAGVSKQLDNKTRQKKEQKTVFGNAFNSGSKQGNNEIHRAFNHQK